MQETVTISKSEYERLLKAEAFLEALEEAGVDNWEGYARALFKEEEAYGE